MVHSMPSYLYESIDTHTQHSTLSIQQHKPAYCSHCTIVRKKRDLLAMERSTKLFAVGFLVLSLISCSCVATLEADEAECADQLANLADCIPFVSGTARKPTPQCCQDTQKVKSTKPKCLCILIKESSDPSMGLPINTTLALQMPSLCNIDSKISNCPTLLNISPDSPDAKIFKEAAGTDSTPTTSGSPSASPTVISPPAISTGSGSKATPNSNSSAARIKSFNSGALFVTMVSFAWIFF